MFADEGPIQGDYHHSGERGLKSTQKRVRYVVTQAKRCVMKNRVLYHMWWLTRGGFREDICIQLAVPPELKVEVMRKCHDSPYTGEHFGHAKTWNKLRDRYLWLQ